MQSLRYSCGRKYVTKYGDPTRFAVRGPMQSDGNMEDTVDKELEFFFDEDEGGAISLDGSKAGKGRVKNKVTCPKVALEQLMKVGGRVLSLVCGC